MTKTGEPSLLSDIRYFAGENRYLEFEQQRELNAFGKRVAWWLNAKGMSLGAFHSLYLALVPGGEQVRLEDAWPGEFWWFRYLYMPASSRFPRGADALEEGRALTLAGLLHLAPQHEIEIREACTLMRASGGLDRLTILEKKLSGQILRICCSLQSYPSPAYLYLIVEDRRTGSRIESPAQALRFMDDAFHLAGKLSADGDGWVLHAKPSYTAELAAKQYGGDLRFRMADMRPASSDLLISQRLKRFAKA